MTLRLLIFAPWTAEDAALWNSRWMAQQTAALLSAVPTATLGGDRAVREALEEMLTGDLGLHVFAQQLVERMVVNR